MDRWMAKSLAARRAAMRLPPPAPFRRGARAASTRAFP